MASRKYQLPVTGLAVSWLGRFARGRLPDRNPLRRASDRVETAVLVLLVIAFLVGTPLAALAAGSWAHVAAHRAQLAQEASWTQVTAVTLAAAPKVGAAPGLVAQVPARWTAPDGAVTTGEVPVLAGSATGLRVRVWSTRDGRLTVPPLQDSQVSGDAVFGGLAGGIGVAVTLSLTWVLARRVIDRRRMAAWDAEWRSTGPHWSTRA